MTQNDYVSPILHMHLIWYLKLKEENPFNFKRQISLTYDDGTSG